MKTWLPYGAAGALATLTGVAVGHLVAALTDPASSPVLAVGSTVIDLTPTPVKELAVREFGTADKPLLIGSVLLAVLVLAGVAGVLARRRLAWGMGAFAVLVALAAACAVLRPAAGVAAVVPSLVAGLVGTAALAWLVSTSSTGAVPHALPRWVSTGSTGARVSTGSTGARVSTGSTGAEVSTSSTGASRRGMLLASGALATVAAATGGLGQWLVRRGAAPADVVLPAAADAADPFPRGVESMVRGVSSLRTPNADFYRVDTLLVVPSIDQDDWALTIDGDVEREVVLSYADLLAMPLMERDITLNCVSNQVGGRYVGSARWLGVPLRGLLDRAGVGSTADQILSTSDDGFNASTPLAVALDGRDAMVAVGMNGEALPRAHGFPARLLTPGLYGFVGATKWLTRLTLTTYDARQAYWTRRGWATDAPVKVASRIDTPKPLSTVGTGRVMIAGVAWAQTRGVGSVEVRVDGGPWQRATLGPEVTLDYWRQWYLPWQAEPGQHLLAVRATTLDGEVQTAVRAEPFPDGATGVQEIAVTVE